MTANEGKRVVITSGRSGIGLVSARLLLDDGLPCRRPRGDAPSRTLRASFNSTVQSIRIAPPATR